MKRLVCLLSLLSVAVPEACPAWSTFHGNNQRNGLTPVTAPAQPKVKWSFDVGGPVICSPVVAPDGSVIVGTTWHETLRPTRTITAVKPDGTLKWRFTLPWFEDQTISTPAVAADGRVYAGTADGTFVALGPDGSELWRYQASEPVRSHVMVGSDGNVYVNLDGKLTSFSPAGTKRWEYTLGTNLEGGPSETLDGKILAVGDTGVVCLNAQGALVWTTPVSGTAAPIAVSPNGDVLVGGQTVTALDSSSGSVKWSAPIFAYGTYASPSVDAQGNVYYGFDYNLYKLSPNGNVLVQKYLEDPNSNFLGSTWSSPLIDGSGRLFWGMATGKRWAIPFEKNLTVFNSGLSIVRQTPLPEALFTSNPAIGDDGTLYAGCLDGKLYAFGP
ncbi:MAG: PQQ-binding-like beta-propeller repeat protein [Armatimonadetes bacterium]|nr:PQQ-binding-like beta-propeller repeat protein [Armatimonadota bacterium]